MLFLFHCRRNRGGAARSEPLHSFEPGNEFVILGFQGHGETEVAFGVFVTAVDFCVIGKAHELREGPVHLFRGSLEESPTAGSEQGVAAKKIITEEISDMSRGVARNEKDRSTHSLQ